MNLSKESSTEQQKAVGQRQSNSDQTKQQNSFEQPSITGSSGQDRSISSNNASIKQPSQGNPRPSSEAARSSATVEREQGKHTGTANAVGHYILGKALGEGTFGKVKLGTHVLTGEKVAVKVLEKSKIKDKKDVERISREIKILKQLHHPNVVQIYEIIETEKDLYLVMEFASGGELFDLIVQNQKLKEKQASRYLQELVAGVHYIHKLGICHRDLKPENLLIDFDGSLKVVDFGLSNMYEQGNTLKTACGSPCYAAPEMIAGNRYHGLKSDIWSCGVVLYAMLCGFLPFEDQKTSNLYKKILNADYTLPKFLSNDAKDIIQKIFVTDPEKRITIEGLRKHPWYKLYQPENTNFNYHNEEVQINHKLIQKLEISLGFSQESVERAVNNNKHNHLSATYYLLLKKYAAQNYKSQQQTRIVTTQQFKESIETSPSKEAEKAKTRPSSQTRVDSEHRCSSKTEEQKQHKLRQKKPTGTENGRITAQVTDSLVLKNHRREQSANATAGRHNKNNGWGDVRDERRTESYERPAIDEDYEIVASKVQNNAEVSAGEKRQNPQQTQKTDHQDLRISFLSPSPEHKQHAATQSNQAANQRKMQQLTQNTNFRTANQSVQQSLERPILSQVNEQRDRKDKLNQSVESNQVNIQNVKQQQITQNPVKERQSSNLRNNSQITQSVVKQHSSQQSQERSKQSSIVENRYANSTITSEAKQNQTKSSTQQSRPSSNYRTSTSGSTKQQRSTEKKQNIKPDSGQQKTSVKNVSHTMVQMTSKTGKMYESLNQPQADLKKETIENDVINFETAQGQRQKNNPQTSAKSQLSQTQKIKISNQGLNQSSLSNSNSRLNQTQTLAIQPSRTHSGQRRMNEPLQSDKQEFIEQAQDIANLINSLNISGLQNPYRSGAQTSIGGETFQHSNQQLPSFLDQIVNKQHLQRQLMHYQNQQTASQIPQTSNQPVKSTHNVEMASTNSMQKSSQAKRIDIENQTYTFESDSSAQILKKRTKTETEQKLSGQNLISQKQYISQPKSCSSKENKNQSALVAGKKAGNFAQTQVLDRSLLNKTIEEEMKDKKKVNMANLYGTQQVSNQINTIHKDLDGIQLSLVPNFPQSSSPTYTRSDQDREKIYKDEPISAKIQQVKKNGHSSLTVTSNHATRTNSNSKNSKATSTSKHARNPASFISQNTNIPLQHLSSYVSEGKTQIIHSSGQQTYMIPTSDTRTSQNQRNNSIQVAPQRNADGNLTPKSQDQRAKNLTSFDSHFNNGLQAKERRTSQQPSQNYNSSINQIGSSTVNKSFRSGSVAGQSTQIGRQNERKQDAKEKSFKTSQIEVPTHEQRFQSITHETGNELFKSVADSEGYLSSSFLNGSGSTKMKSSQNYYKRKQQVQSITELLNQTQPSTEIRKIQFKSNIPDESNFTVQTNNFFHIGSQPQTGQHLKKSLILSQELGINLQTAFSQQERTKDQSQLSTKSNQGKPNQTNYLSSGQANQSKISSFDNSSLNLSQNQAYANHLQHQQQSYLNDLLKQTNNLTFSDVVGNAFSQSSQGLHSQGSKNSNSHAQNKYVQNTSDIFSPVRPKSVTISQPQPSSNSSKHIQHELNFSQGQLTSPTNHSYQMQQPQTLTTAAPKQDNASQVSQLQYNNNCLQEMPFYTSPQTNNSYMNLTNTLNSVFYGNSGQVYQKQPSHGGVVPQPLPSQQQTQNFSYQSRQYDNFNQQQFYSQEPAQNQPIQSQQWSHQSQVPTHYQMYNQQMLQLNSLYNSQPSNNVRSSKPSISYTGKADSPTSKFALANKGFKYSGQQSLKSNTEADKQYAQAIALQRGIGTQQK